MKVFQIVPYYPPHVGGMEYYVQRLSEELVVQGHDVTVFTTSNYQLPSIQRVNGVKIHFLKKMTNIYNIPIVPSLLSHLLNSLKPDLVHAHQYPVFFSDISAVVALLKKMPLLVHVHVVSDAKSPLSRFMSDIYYTTLGLQTLNIADTVIVPSQAYRTKLIGMHVNPEHLRVIPYGIDTKKFSQNQKGHEFRKKWNCENSRIILSVGRLNYQKGFHNLLLAMPAIIKHFPDTKLVVVGEGEQEAYLKSLAKLKGVASSVVFTGGLSQADIPAAYAACDVFVLPSLFESFGISLIEAQAMGKPVVCTRTGGAPEAVLEGKTGLIVEPTDVKQLESAVLHLLNDEKLSRMMGYEGQRFVNARYDMKKIITSLIKQYERTVSDR